jgi:hypothetical protein
MQPMELQITKRHVKWTGVLRWGDTICETKEYIVPKNEFTEDELTRPPCNEEDYKYDRFIHNELYLALEQKMKDIGWPQRRGLDVEDEEAFANHIEWVNSIGKRLLKHYLGEIKLYEWSKIESTEEGVH